MELFCCFFNYFVFHVFGKEQMVTMIVCVGPVGMAAAAAIVSAKKRKRPHSFETNPSIRKRQQNRLLRKLRVRRQAQNFLRKV